MMMIIRYVCTRLDSPVYMACKLIKRTHKLRNLLLKDCCDFKYNYLFSSEMKDEEK